MREFYGCGSDKSGGFFPNPNKDVGDAIEDIHVLGVQHLLRQLIMRHVDLRELEIALTETNLPEGEAGREHGWFTNKHS